MKRRYLIVLLLFCLVPFLTFGHDTADEAAVEVVESKHPYLTDDFQFTFNAGVNVSQFQWGFTGGFQFDFRANPVLGVGFKSTVDYGFKYENLNVNLFAVFDIWWFYVGPGISFKAIGMTIPSDDPDYARAYVYQPLTSLAVTVGFRFPFVRIGPGNITMDMSIDWYQNDIPLTQPVLSLPGKTINELLNSTMYAFKFGARLGYTF